MIKSTLVNSDTGSEVILFSIIVSDISNTASIYTLNINIYIFVT